MERAPIRIFIVSSRSELTERILGVLMFQSDLAIVGLVRSLEDAIRQAQQASPDVVLVGDPLDGQEEQLRRLAMEAPSASVIALCLREDARAAQRALLAGARAFIPDPFDDQELLMVIREVYALEMQRRARLGEPVLPALDGRPGWPGTGDGLAVRPGAHLAPSQGATAVPGQKTGPVPAVSLSRPARGRILTLLSPKGGAGRSTIATNLAVLLRQETGKEVILIDARRSLGDLDTMLNLVPTSTLADLGPDVSDVDGDLLKSVLLKHISGIYVLLAPQQIDEKKLPDHTGFEHILDLACHTFDYVVVDTGHLTDPYTSVVLQYTDHLLLITVPEMPALQRTTLFMEAARQYGFPFDHISLVVNRSTARGGITQQHIQERLGTETAFTVPEDIPLATYSINQGIPLVLSHPKSAIAFSLSQMARKLIAKESQPARTADTGAPATTDQAHLARSEAAEQTGEPRGQPALDGRPGWPGTEAKGDGWQRIVQRLRRRL